MPTYKFKFRRRFSPFYRTLSVCGHSYDPQTDKMWLQLPTGGMEVLRWSNCKLVLGEDWDKHIEGLERQRLEREAKA